MSYLDKLKSKTSPPGELQKLQKEIEMENKATRPTAKSAKRPFDSFYSTPGSRFSENEDFNLEIEPMATCLHGKPCPHLDAPGKQRPGCRKASSPVFNIAACPLGKWAGNLTT